MTDRSSGSLRNLSFAVLLVGVCSAALVVLTVTPAQGGLNHWYLGVLNIVYWGAWAALIPVAARVAWWIRAQFTDWRIAVFVHIAAAALCALLHITAISTARVLLNYWVAGEPILADSIWGNVTGTGRQLLEWEFTMYGAISVFAYAAALQEEARRRELAVVQLQAGLVEARLLSLQRQLQPHFLFNTLHAVSVLIRRDPATAETMIDRLSKLLRTTFRSGAAAEVRLADDLATLYDYVAIESAQMRERLSVSYDIDDAALDAAVPVLLTQPLVENAVRHGVQPRASGGAVRVSARRRGGDLHISIVDDGVGLSDTVSETGGVGLANTRSRLEQLYGARYEFSVTDLDTGGVCVSLRIPFRSMNVTTVGAS